jgi:hypothetical protein
MSKKLCLSVFSIIILLSLVLFGCANSASSPEISFEPHRTPIAIYPPGIPRSYRANLEISVADVDIATAKAAQMIKEFDGNIVDSSAWYSRNQKNVKLEIDVPFRNFEGLHASLLGLGKILKESPAGNSTIPNYDTNSAYEMMSHISLMIISERAVAFPNFQIAGWNPLSTFRRAFNIFIRIFGFLVDILIWLLVVLGPFLLIGLGFWWLFRRVRRHKTGN